MHGVAAVNVPAISSRRIVITTFGSLGDLHPYIALAQGLRERGQRPVIATTPVYQKRIENAGIEFAPMRPDTAELGEENEVLRKACDPRTGTEYVLRELTLPWIKHSYEDLLAACSDADLLIGHPLTFAAPLVAEKLRLPWVASVLQPIIYMSAHDPSVPAQLAWVARMRWLGPTFFRALWKLPRAMSRSWTKPIEDLRRELGLSPSPGHPIFEGQFSPHLNLALFSQHFAAPQIDWPGNTATTGFLFHDRNEAGEGLADDLRAFLDAGPPPVVFTLGSTAVMLGKHFYEISFTIARRLGVRAVLLTGRDESTRPTQTHPDIFVANYAPYSELFPHAAAVVHQGGVGTTAQVIAAGVPMLVVPFAHDQPDNAARVERLGVGRSLPIGKYKLLRATGEVRRILESPRYAQRAKALGELIRAEDGVARACETITNLLESGCHRC